MMSIADSASFPDDPDGTHTGDDIEAGDDTDTEEPESFPLLGTWIGASVANTPDCSEVGTGRVALPIGRGSEQEQP